MKNSKSFSNMFVFAISALFLTSCNPTIEPSPIETPLIINGDTIKTIILKDFQKLANTDPMAKSLVITGDTIVKYVAPKLNTVSGMVSLTNLKNNDDADLKGKPLRYVAIGGGLAAGVRDGGYFNEGIITSYPNFLARQMQLQKFEQPLFSSNAYNGYGRKSLTKNNYTGGPVPKFNYVKNNSAVQSIGNNNISLEKYKGNVDNFAMPYILGYSTLNPLHTISSENYKESFDLNSQVFDRIIQPTQGKYGFVNSLLANKFDFFTLELGWSNVIYDLVNGYGVSGPIDQDKYIFGEEYIYDATNLGISSEVRFMRVLEKNKIKKGVLLNVPNMLNFPYFKIITDELISKTIGNQTLYYGITSSSYWKTLNRDEYILLPTSEVDSLLSNKVAPSLKKGLNSRRPLNINSVLRIDNIKGINNYNIFTASIGKRYNFAVVDLYGLYEKIIQGNHVTDDGVRVDATWATGNFFSADGIYPTAFGQAVITNEIIKTINKQYQTTIPLINTKEFLVK